MGTLRKDMKKYFKTENLYEIFNVAKESSADDIKKAYRKASLLVHPDRVGVDDKELATAKFQVIGKAYSILSDEEKRKVYDRTGIVEDELVSDQSKDWYAYYRAQFPVITAQDIDQFEKEYVGSDEEKEDLLKYYQRFKGDMNMMMEFLFFYKFEREDKFRAVIKEAIKNKQVPDYKAFSKESAASIAARQKRCEREAKAAEREQKKRDKSSKQNGTGDMGDLVAIIQQRQQERSGNLVDGLEGKYGKKWSKKGTTKKSKKSADDDDESLEEDGEWEGLDGDDTGKADSDEEEQKPKSSKAKSKRTTAQSKSAAAKRPRRS